VTEESLSVYRSKKEIQDAIEAQKAEKKKKHDNRPYTTYQEDVTLLTRIFIAVAIGLILGSLYAAYM
jgi:F0F1-type ATP synthase assembly protein I